MASPTSYSPLYPLGIESVKQLWIHLCWISLAGKELLTLSERRETISVTRGAARWSFLGGRQETGNNQAAWGQCWTNLLSSHGAPPAWGVVVRKAEQAQLIPQSRYWLAIASELSVVNGGQEESNCEQERWKKKRIMWMTDTKHFVLEEKVISVTLV